MVIIQHKDGWSASNSGFISNKPKLVKINDRDRAFKDSFELDVEGLYTVKGDCLGDVKIAIRDSVTNELKCYNGTFISRSKFDINGECDSEWLKKI